jgi:hypothetical protein
MDDLIDIEQYLSQIQTRKPGSVEDEDVLQRLAGLKEQAVSRNDQLLAKKLWCYETILQVQNKYISAFEMMKEQDFYSAWCVLERVEINLVGLERHFDLDTEGHDKLRLSFIKKHTEQFQSLFPYRMFISPAYMALEKVCSVCDKPISIRNPCGHVVGEIYDGEMCVRRIFREQCDRKSGGSLQLLVRRLCCTRIKSPFCGLGNRMDCETTSNI